MYTSKYAFKFIDSLFQNVSGLLVYYYRMLTIRGPNKIALNALFFCSLSHSTRNQSNQVIHACTIACKFEFTHDHRLSRVQNCFPLSPQKIPATKYSSSAHTHNTSHRTEYIREYNMIVAPRTAYKVLSSAHTLNTTHNTEYMRIYYDCCSTHCSSSQKNNNWSTITYMPLLLPPRLRL